MSLLLTCDPERHGLAVLYRSSTSFLCISPQLLQKGTNSVDYIDEEIWDIVGNDASNFFDTKIVVEEKQAMPMMTLFTQDIAVFYRLGKRKYETWSSKRNTK